MKRWIVITNFDGDIDVPFVGCSHEEAKEFMYLNFRGVLNGIPGNIFTDYIYDNSASIDYYGDTYDWLIKEIEV